MKEQLAVMRTTARMIRADAETVDSSADAVVPKVQSIDIMSVVPPALLPGSLASGKERGPDGVQTVIEISLLASDVQPSSQASGGGHGAGSTAPAERLELPTEGLDSSSQLPTEGLDSSSQLPTKGLEPSSQLPTEGLESRSQCTAEGLESSSQSPAENLESSSPTTGEVSFNTVSRSRMASPLAVDDKFQPHDGSDMEENTPPSVWLHENSRCFHPDAMIGFFARYSQLCTNETGSGWSNEIIRVERATTVPWNELAALPFIEAAVSLPCTRAFPVPPAMLAHLLTARDSAIVLLTALHPSHRFAF